MNIKATEELTRELVELDAKIKHLEKCPNRAFVLIEYETVSSFHWYNLCFDKFWKEFDHRSASQLLLLQKFMKTHSDLCNRYAELFREQIGYLEEILDFEDHSFNELPPVILSEDNHKDVVGYYAECFKNDKDEEGKSLYDIELDSDTHYEVIDGRDVPIDLYIFRSDKLNEDSYKSLAGLHKSLKSIFSFMGVVCNYPNSLINGYKPQNKEVISALERELRQYAQDIGKKVERDLKKIAQGLKNNRNESLTPHLWGLVMKEEDEMFEQAINTQVGEIEDKYFENISATKDQLIDNYSLLQKIKSTCLDGELFDIVFAVETHNLLSSLNAGNLDLFYELVLRRNIIQREMFHELKIQYEEWLNPVDNHQEYDSNEKPTLSITRQAKLAEISEILLKSNWKQPATAEKVKLLLDVVFGKELSLLESKDIPQCEKMWALVESGRGDRMEIVPANLAGFFSEENLIVGSPKEISNNLFGKNNNQSNNINKGKSNNCSIEFDNIIPFIKKYIQKIIRQ